MFQKLLQFAPKGSCANGFYFLWTTENRYKTLHLYTQSLPASQTGSKTSVKGAKAGKRTPEGAQEPPEHGDPALDPLPRRRRRSPGLLLQKMRGDAMRCLRLPRPAAVSVSSYFFLRLMLLPMHGTDGGGPIFCKKIIKMAGKNVQPNWDRILYLHPKTIKMRFCQNPPN